MAEATGAPHRPTPTVDGARLDPPPPPPGPAARSSPALPSRIGAVLAGRPLTLAAGAVAALPIAASAVRAVHVGWEPTDDKAIIATRAYDVLTRHTPLVGQFSMAGVVTGHPAHDLGPMLYWLLAVPVRLGSPAAMAVTMGVVNVAAVAAVVALARAGGGLPLMFMTAAAIPIMSMSLAAETFHDIWNPAAALFPFLLLIFLCWSLASGRYRLLPVTVLVASFVVQTHLVYLAPTLGLLAIGLAGLMVTWGAGVRPRPPRRSVAVVLAAAVAVGAICWAPAVVDEVTARTGNLTSVVRDATAPKATLGAAIGAHAVARAIGVRPWWLTVPRTRWDRKHDVRATPSLTRRLTTLALMAALALIAVAGAVRRRIDVAAAGLIGLVLCAGLAVVASATPALPVLAATLGYTLWWGSQVGLWVWLVVAWAAWLVLARTARSPAVRRGSAPVRYVGSPARVVPALGVVAGLAGVGIAAGTATAAEVPDQHAALYRPIAAIGARLDAAVPRGRTVRLDGRLDVATQPVKAAVRYELAGRGVRVLARGATARNGAWYELDHRPYDTVITLTDRPRRPRGASLLVGVGFTEHGVASSVYVWRSLARGAPRDSPADRRSLRSRAPLEGHGRRARPRYATP